MERGEKTSVKKKKGRKKKEKQKMKTVLFDDKSIKKSCLFMVQPRRTIYKRSIWSNSMSKRMVALPSILKIHYAS